MRTRRPPSLVSATVGAAYDRSPAPAIVTRQEYRHTQRQRKVAKSWQRLHSRIERSGISPLGKLYAAITRSVLDRLKQAESVAVSVDELFLPSEWESKFIATIEPLLLRGMSAGVDFEAAWVGDRVGTDGDKQSAEPIPELLLDYSPLMQRRIRDIIAERAVGLWNRIGKTTKSVLGRAVSRGIIEGDPLRDLEERLRQVLTNHSRASVHRIARTESTVALNNGQQLEREELGVAHKGWISTVDVRTRGLAGDSPFDHYSPNGQVVENDGLFLISGQQLAFPGDGAHGASAGNIINCRCVSVAEFKRRNRNKPRDAAG